MKYDLSLGLLDIFNVIQRMSLIWSVVALMTKKVEKIVFAPVVKATARNSRENKTKRPRISSPSIYFIAQPSWTTLKGSDD